MGQSAAAGAAAGTSPAPPGPVIPNLSRDDAGQVQIGTAASGTGTGVLCTVTFAGSYSGPDMPSPLKILITPLYPSAAAAAIGLYVSAVTTHTFTLSVTSAPPVNLPASASGIVVNWQLLL